MVAHYATADVDDAVARMVERGLRSGRYVPEDYLREVHVGVSRVVPEAIKAGLFDEFTLWDTSTRPPLKIATAIGKKLTIVDAEKWSIFIKKGEAKLK